MTLRSRAQLFAHGGGAVISLLLVAGCGEYLPTNPYDARFANTLTLEGPDTTYSIGQVVVFTVNAVPAWPDARAIWASSNDALKSLGGGQFQVMTATHDDEFATITATLGTKILSRSIRVRQRAFEVLLQGVPSNTRSDSSLAFALGAGMPLTVTVKDTNGNFIPDTLESGRVLAVLEVRDTTVAALVGYRLYSRGVGRTWVIGQADGRTDSLVVRVLQYPASVSTTLGTVQLNPGDSARVTITGWVDANSYALTTPPIVLGWRVVPAFVGTATVTTVTQNGVVHVNPQSGEIGVDVVQVHWGLPDGSADGWLNAGTVFVGQAPF